VHERRSKREGERPEDWVIGLRNLAPLDANVDEVTPPEVMRLAWIYV
jgi:hypothetical protein